MAVVNKRTTLLYILTTSGKQFSFSMLIILFKSMIFKNILDLIFESRMKFRHNEPQESKETLKLSSNTSVFSIALNAS